MNFFKTLQRIVYMFIFYNNDGFNVQSKGIYYIYINLV